MIFLLCVVRRDNSFSIAFGFLLTRGKCFIFANKKRRCVEFLLTCLKGNAFNKYTDYIIYEFDELNACQMLYLPSI